MTQELSPFNFPYNFQRAEFDAMLVFAYQASASDITLQPGIPAMAEIHGRQRKLSNRPLDPKDLRGAISILYGENGHAILSGGADIDEQYDIVLNRQERVSFRVNATSGHIPGGASYQITMRTIPGMPPTVEDLGLEPEIVANMTPNQGMVLVVGVTGSGKSTLLAALIRYILEKIGNRKICTYEDPIEFVHSGIKSDSCIIWQTEIGRHLRSGEGESPFAYGVRNALRRKPTDILIGEARDVETIKALLEASLTGHTTYSTVHADSAAITVSRLLMKFPEESRAAVAYDMVSMLRLIVAQRLVPSVDGKRVALREYFVFDQKVREELKKLPPEKISTAIAELVDRQGTSMFHAAQREFAAGKISEDVFRKMAIERGEK